MKTKEEILISNCESGHESDWSYIDIEKDVIDGKASHVLAAMEEYAHHKNCNNYMTACEDCLQEFYKWKSEKQIK